MHLHREGYNIIAISIAATILILAAMIAFINPWTMGHNILAAILLIITTGIVWFFRIPHRNSTQDSNKLIAPADGTVVTIEETYEREYIKGECIQISIFMSLTNVHVNRYPCDGVVEYVKYTRGNYFVAAYPKSSDLNEHASVGIRLADGNRILIRQIAGAVARRIVCYATEGEQVKQNQELGFIRFGSRVDVFMPKSFVPSIEIGERVKNAITPIARTTK